MFRAADFENQTSATNGCQNPAREGRLTSGAGLGEESFRVPFAWSPDAKRIAYSRVGKQGSIIEGKRS
jgi:hypothetical protein